MNLADEITYFMLLIFGLFSEQVLVNKSSLVNK